MKNIIHVTLVHGNDDVIEKDFDELSEAIRWLNDEEISRGHSVMKMQETFSAEYPGLSLQWGTGYHYVTFERRLS
jgi:hypothetical protein